MCALRIKMWQIFSMSMLRNIHHVISVLLPKFDSPWIVFTIVFTGVFDCKILYCCLGGWYLYLKPNATQKGLSRARLISPDVAAGQNCLMFFYHMYGNSVDRLRVYVQTGLALPKKPLWIRKGTQGNTWKQAMVDVSAKVPFNVWYSISISLCFKI